MILEQWEKTLAEYGLESSTCPQQRTATIRSRPSSQRRAVTEDDKLPPTVTPPKPGTPVSIPKTPRVYTSVAELKRWKVSLY